MVDKPDIVKKLMEKEKLVRTVQLGEKDKKITEMIRKKTFKKSEK